METFLRYRPFPRGTTSHRWIPLTMASDAELWCFLWPTPKQTGWANSRYAGDLRRLSAHCDVIAIFVRRKEELYTMDESYTFCTVQWIIVTTEMITPRTCSWHFVKSVSTLLDLCGGPLQWRHNERHGVSNHQTHDCLLNRLSKRRSKKTSKLPRYWP